MSLLNTNPLILLVNPAVNANTVRDLIALAKGQSAADLFQRGKLRVDGDMRPAHKLGFLKGLA